MSHLVSQPLFPSETSPTFTNVSERERVATQDGMQNDTKFQQDKMRGALSSP